MSLTSALLTGKSALTVSQVGLQVTGNNMANATTAGFTRQTVALSPASADRITSNAFVGRGVRLDEVVRHVDEALQGRLRLAMSEESASSLQYNLLVQIESIQNELTEHDLSTELAEFFNAWSELSRTPSDDAARTLTIEQGTALSEHLRTMREDIEKVRQHIDDDLHAQVSRADALLTQIADLNRSIVNAEMGVSTSSALRDRRDAVLEELSGYLDITTVQQPDGAVDVLVGSTPLVLRDQSRGLELSLETRNDELVAMVRVSADQGQLDIRSGSIGALVEAREADVNRAIERLDDLAGTLIHEVNRLHSQGQGKVGFASITGAYRVTETDVPLNHPDADLPFTIGNGSFQLHLTHVASGSRVSHQIDIDLDGIGADTTLDDLVAQINAAAGPDITASIASNGALRLDAANGFEMSFSDDSAGVLAGLGLNTYFVGRNASDIAVHDGLQAVPNRLAAGGGHVPGSNDVALAISELGEQPSDRLGGMTLQSFWSTEVEELGVRTSSARDRALATAMIREGLQAQEAAVSGVSIDEETIQLMNYQRQYEAAARFISVIDNVTQILLNLV